VALLTSQDLERMLERTGGVPVTHGGDSTFGHFERVPMEVGAGDYVGGLLTTAPSVVIADGRLSGIGPRTGIDETVVVDGDSWRVADIQPGSDEGLLLRLMLTEV